MILLLEIETNNQEKTILNFNNYITQQEEIKSYKFHNTDILSEVDELKLDEIEIEEDDNQMKECCEFCRNEECDGECNEIRECGEYGGEDPSFVCEKCHESDCMGGCEVDDEFKEVEVDEIEE